MEFETFTCGISFDNQAFCGFDEDEYLNKFFKEFAVKLYDIRYSMVFDKVIDGHLDADLEAIIDSISITYRAPVDEDELDEDEEDYNYDNH